MKHQDIETLPKVSQVKLDLIAAKSLIDTPEKWCQFESEKTRPDGRIQRCSVGALVAAVNDRRYIEAVKALQKYAEPFADGEVSIKHFNDNHTHAEVMAWWDRAIASV